MIKQVFSETNPNQVIFNIKEAANFSDIVVVVSATQEGATPHTQASFNNGASVRYIKRGEEKVNVQPRWLQFINNLWGGAAITLLGVNDEDPVRYAFKIPRSFLGENNVDHIEPGDNAQVIIQWPAAFGTLAEDENTEIFFVPAEGVHLYDLTIKQTQHNMAANQVLNITISEDNITWMGIAAQDSNGVPTLAAAEALDDGRFNLMIGGQNYNGSINALQHWTTLQYELDAATVVNADCAVLYDGTLTGLKQGNGLADSAQLDLTNGAAADVASLVVMGRRFAQKNYVASATQNAAFKQAQAEAKRLSGKTTANARLIDAQVF